jgi:hypothetical protein
MNACPLLCLPLLLTAVLCQQPPPVDPPNAEAPTPEAAAQKVLDEVLQQFQKEGIEFDAKAQTVTIPAVVNQPQDAIEYLLIHRKGKRHEAIFWTRCKPSVLNAALMMLGLTPGKNASYVEKDPPPTLEEIEAGADPIVITAPTGTPLWMTVKWKDADGKVVEHCIEDLLLDLTTQQPVADATWVYLGGRMAKIYRDEPEVYVADFEGNLISVCYLTPDNHLGTMVHKDARDDQNWWITNLLPEPETEVSFVFHRNEPKLHQERRARLLREREQAEAAPAKTDETPPPK